MTLCPCCNRPLPGDQPTASQLRDLMDALRDMQVNVLPGGLISEPDLADLLGLSRSALRKRHERGTGPLDYVRRGNRRYYRITDLGTSF